MVYGCDGPWWKNNKGLPDFEGIKLSHDTNVCAEFRDLHKVEVLREHRILVDEPGVVGSGGCSGFQALNLAIQFGAKKIVLIGFDAHSGSGLHWYGPNVGKGMRNPANSTFVIWRDALHGQQEAIRRLGVEVINASPDSAIRCFKFMSVESALAHWRI